MYLAQANYSRWRAEASPELIADFYALVGEINQLAESSAGFVWRYVGLADNSDVVTVFKDPRVIFNMSVWESLDHLKQFAFRSAHNPIMLRRQTWFVRPDNKTSVLWWIKAGDIPSLQTAKAKLDLINRIGPSEDAFGFASVFAPPD